MPRLTDAITACVLLLPSIARGAPGQHGAKATVSWTPYEFLELQQLDAVFSEGVPAKLYVGTNGGYLLDPITGELQELEVFTVEDGMVRVYPHNGMVTHADFDINNPRSTIVLGASPGLFDAVTHDLLASDLPPAREARQDFDQDGHVDGCGYDGVVRYARGDVLPLPDDPDPGVIWQHDYHACLPDMNGDGYGDLLVAPYSTDDLVYLGYVIGQTGGPVSL